MQPFLEKYRVIGIKHRPLWEGAQISEVKSWHRIADDLIDFLDQQGAQQIIGVGHSLGAVSTLLAAEKRPDLFRALVLIEPALLPPRLRFWIRLTPHALRMRIPIVQTALRRRDTWESPQALFNYYRPKRVFSQLSDSVLWDFVKFGTRETADGQITLAYSKEWEAHIYSRITPIWRSMRRVHTPTFAIRAGKSDTVSPESWAYWQKMQPSADFLEIPDTTHLLPLERPLALAQTVLTYLDKLTSN